MSLSVTRTVPPREPRDHAVGIMFLIGVILLVLRLVLLTGCTPHEERPPCKPEELARIDAAFVAEAVAACAGSRLEACAAYPAIKAKYAARREEWIACR